MLVLTPASAADEVVSTASGSDRAASELAASLNALDGDAIAGLRPTHPADIMERFAGVSLSWLGGDHHTMTIRQPINFNPVYLYAENGIPTRPTGFLEANPFFDMNLPQARRIEVLRGPGTAIWGSDALAGVVNILTPDPTEDVTILMSADLSTRGYKRFMGSVSGTHGRHGLRADVNLSQDSGWRDDTESDRQLATLTWTIADIGNWSVKNVLMLANVDQDSSGSNLPRADYENNPTRNTTPIAFRRVKSLRAQSHWTWSEGELAIQITPYARANETELAPFFAFGFDPHIEDIASHSVGVKLRGERNVFGVAKLIGGVDVDYSSGTRVDQSIDITREDGIAVSFIPVETIYDFATDLVSVSPYLRAEWQILDSLRLNAGLRYDWLEYDYDNRLTDSETGPFIRPPDQSRSYDRFTPKVGIVWEVSDRWALVASYRQGFRVPTAAQLFRPRTNAESTELEPVKAENIEVGLRARPLDWLRLEITAYRQVNRDDILVFTDNATGVRQIENAGKTRHHGIEVSLQADFSEEWSFATVWSFADHQFLRWQPVPGVDLSGNDINRGAGRIGNTRLAWTPAFCPGLRAEVEWQHLDGYPLDDNNTRFYEGHDLVHLRASYALTDAITLGMRLHNLFDARYATNGRFNAFAGEELKPGLPRTAFFSISARL